MSVKKMSLKVFIKKVGAKDLAAQLKVHDSAVRHWGRGFVLPRADQMLRIERVSKGAVTVQTMVEDFCAPKNSKNRWRQKKTSKRPTKKKSKSV